MNNYKIIFSELYNISDCLERGHEDSFVEYLNSFKGDNVFEKFQTIMKCWELDVSPSIQFNFNDKPTKLQISYLLSQVVDMSDDVVIENDGMKLIIGLPSVFQNYEFVPIYTSLKFIELYGVSIDLSKLSLHEKIKIIDNLPTKIHNIISKAILSDKSKVFEMENPILREFKLNFFSNDVYLFFKRLFLNFDEYYFKDVIYHLSKRIGGDIVMGSKPIDIQYYIERYEKELETDNNKLNI